MAIPTRETDPFVLLRTKFQRPRLRENLVSRPRLLDKLHECEGRNDSPVSGFTRKLILVSAPAGYGKTTAMGQWLDECPYPSTWVSLDSRDSDLSIFLTYFTAAVQTAYPGACPLTSGLLQTHQLPPNEYLATMLTNELSDLPGRLVIALDDFHHICDEDVPKLVTVLLDHLPPQVCLAIISRQDPNLPLMRLRANGEMTELRMADLSFTPNEVQAFLEQAVGKRLNSEAVETLDKRTEGWIVGLRLAALTLRGATDPGAFVLAFQASGNRYVMEYLVDEVLSQQPQTIQNFLLRSSILDRFCAPLCDAILDQQNSRVIIEELDHTNLFLVALDVEGKWYRYHHLFQELLAHRLQAQMPGDEIELLYSRASAWFAGNELIEEAMTHALAAGDIMSAAYLVEDNYRQAVNQGQWARLNRWLQLMPDTIIKQRPGLLVARAWCLHREFKLAATVPIIMSAEAILENPDPSPSLNLHEKERRYLLGETTGLLSQALYFLGDFETGRTFAEECMAQLSEMFTYGRGGALFYWGLHCHALGRREEATRRLLQLIRAESESTPLTLLLYNSLCYIYRATADFPRLSKTAHEYLNAALRANRLEAAGFAHCHLGILHYEWNELELAQHHFEAVIKSRYYAHELSYQTSMQGLVLVLLAQDRLTDVQDTIAAMDEFAQKNESHLLLASGRSFQARLLLLQGNLEQADRQSIAAYTGPQVEPMLQFEIPALTRANVLVRRNTAESLRQGETLLNELLVHTKSTRYVWRQVQVLALQALTLAKRNDTEEALSLLEQTVALARPGWLVRTFVDLGYPLVCLLRQLASRGIEAEYISHVLAAFESGSQATMPVIDSKPEIVEPLTDRELEVLGLLGERLTNQEIAQQLIISPKTVKRHASNIYEKLGVGDRREAAARARELGILPPTLSQNQQK